MKGGKEWEVKKVLSRRLDKTTNEFEYLIEWHGNWANEWQPESCLENAAEAMSAYTRSLGDNNKQHHKRRKT